MSPKFSLINTAINAKVLLGKNLNLLAPGHALGFPRPSVERGPFMSFGGGALGSTSHFAGRECVLGGDRRLLPSQKTVAGKVLFRGSLLSRTNVGFEGRSDVAVKRTPRIDVRWVDSEHA